MSVSVYRKPSQFSYRYIADDKLPEGRTSFPLTLQFLPGGANSAASLPIPINPTGALELYEFDARTYQNVSDFSAFKSVDFFAEFIVYQLTQNPRIYLFSPDSGDFHAIIPTSIDPTLTTDGWVAYVAGTFPIVTNSSVLQIIAEFGTNLVDGTSIQLALSCNNFVKTPYVYQSPIANLDYLHP